uniref:Uncharacterized protein n=1 Tax=Romanomermis culicivorax TaxID=13658 RepID=A0A915L566_ROMCU
MSNQELGMKLHQLKGTIKVLFNIMANAATEDNKRETENRHQEQERQVQGLVMGQKLIKGKDKILSPEVGEEQLGKFDLREPSNW